MNEYVYIIGKPIHKDNEDFVLSKFCNGYSILHGKNGIPFCSHVYKSETEITNYLQYKNLEESLCPECNKSIETNAFRIFRRLGDGLTNYKENNIDSVQKTTQEIEIENNTEMEMYFYWPKITELHSGNIFLSTERISFQPGQKRIIKEFSGLERSIQHIYNRKKDNVRLSNRKVGFVVYPILLQEVEGITKVVLNTMRLETKWTDVMHKSRRTLFQFAKDNRNIPLLIELVKWEFTRGQDPIKKYNKFKESMEKRDRYVESYQAILQNFIVVLPPFEE